MVLSTARTCVPEGSRAAVDSSNQKGLGTGVADGRRLILGLDVAQGVTVCTDKQSSHGRRIGRGVVHRHLVHGQQAERQGYDTGPEQQRPLEVVKPG